MLSTKAGLKNVGMVFLLTDAQVPDEQFLVLINDLLASGEIPGLFPDDEVENIISSLRNEVKGSGLQDTRENCWKFFIERVRRQLKVCQFVTQSYCFERPLCLSVNYNLRQSCGMYCKQQLIFFIFIFSLKFKVHNTY